MTAMTSLSSMFILPAWLAKIPRLLLSRSKYWSVASVMAPRVYLSIIVDLPPNDRAKVDTIFLVIPAGKLGYGNLSSDFFIVLGALSPALVVCIRVDGSHVENTWLGLLVEISKLLLVLVCCPSGTTATLKLWDSEKKRRMCSTSELP